jgi:hypothetical protein
VTVLDKTQTIIVPQTAAVTEEQDLSTKYYKNVVVAADGLAGAEEVDIFIKVNGEYVIYASGGTAIKLTATQPSATLPGGPIYGFLKDATAGACGVFALLSLGNKRR